MTAPKGPPDPALTPPAGEGLDCVGCGACCFSAEPGYIELFAVDRDRLTAADLTFTESRGGRSFMRFEQGRCVALRIEPPGRFTCAVYPRRPDACRWLAVASGECHDQRTRKLSEALLAVEKLRRRPAR